MALVRPCESLVCEITIKTLALPTSVQKISFTRQYNHDVTVSCDNQVAFPSFIASIVVAVVAMYGVRWLAWLPKVCNYQLPV